MRIVSLLPSATEILFALGLAEQVLAVTFECDYPPEARAKPIVVRSMLPHDLTPAEIDRAVSEHAARGESIYQLDPELLAALDPDLIVTQELCDVCAVNPSHLVRALGSLPRQPAILSLTPHTLSDILTDIARTGEATGTEAAARVLIAALQARLDAIREAPKPHRPSVATLEWLDPPFNAGHWLPEMVALAGGREVMGRGGQHSTRVPWEQLRAADPDVLLVAPCGYDAPTAAAEYRRTAFPEWWRELRAVRSGCVFAVDANAYTSRPGPRLVDGVELLYALLQDLPVAHAGDCIRLPALAK